MNNKQVRKCREGKVMDEKIKKIVAGVDGLLERIANKSEPFYSGQAIGLNYVKALLQDTFPELKESEDERVRKEIDTLYSQIDTCILELIKARTDKDSEAEGKALFKMEALMVATLQYLSCIEAYLEKQKEQKPVEIHIDNPNIQKFDPDVKVTTSDSSADGKELLYVSNKSYDIGFRDGVASVKPAEWSEEDRSVLIAILLHLNPPFHDMDEMEMTWFNWLQSLPERFNLQSKQEWSDEDEENFKWFDKFFRAESIVVGGRDIPQDKYLWFKSLRPQPSWKPSGEQMPDSTRIIAEWEKEKAVLEQKDFRGDAERMAYNAFLDGFVKGLGYEGTK